MMSDATLAALLSPLVLGVFGLLIGSFLNVVVHRLPVTYMREWWRHDIADFVLADPRSWKAAFGAKAEPPANFAPAAKAISVALDGLPPLTLLRPRSRCPACGHQLRWFENIPVFSWLFLRGRCSACSAPISLRYPVVEAATAIAFAGCGVVHGATAQALVFCAALSLLLVMALIDLDFTLLPDGLTIPLVVLGLVAAAAHWTPVTFPDAALGALCGYGVLWAFGAFWHVVLRKPNAMAEGDMKMLAGIGALLGWQALPGVLVVAASVGALVGIALILFGGHHRDKPIPFGPYLALAGLGGVFFGDAVRGFGDLLQPLLR